MFVLLDNSSGSGPASLLFAEPRLVVSAQRPDEIAGALGQIETALGNGLYAAGFLTYELGYALEPRLAARLPASRRLPLLWFGVFDPPHALSETQVLAFLASKGEGATTGPITPDLSATDYAARFAQAHQMISAGDIYQLNLTFKVRFQLSGAPLAFYAGLRQRQPVAHGAVVDTGAATILSLSPEQFFARDGQSVTSRPMKGTAARGTTPETDALARAALGADPKQRAENLMIVDLMRNDIGRMAEIGSVAVTDLFTVETYRSVHQMTSGVTARLRKDAGLREMLCALFPPGSVTGAPKIRAMELISDLEAEPRGVYCGAIGYFGPGDVARFNVAIRSPVIFASGSAEMGVGSGVIADSTAQSEYDECLLKMKFLTPDGAGFDLIETMLFEPGKGLWLLDRHLERLARTARYFGFWYCEPNIRQVLEERTKASGGTRSRVRMLLSETGAISITIVPLPPAAPDAAMCYVLADAPIDSTDPFLAHKTTNRQRYDGDWQRLAEATGAGEVIYVNERGELTEGSRTNVFIERDGVLLTPPTACGVLPGVLRAELLATGRAREAVLGLADLGPGARVFLGNSVRGLVRAEGPGTSD